MQLQFENAFVRQFEKAFYSQWRSNYLLKCPKGNACGHKWAQLSVSLPLPVHLLQLSIKSLSTEIINSPRGGTSFG